MAASGEIAMSCVSGTTFKSMTASMSVVGNDTGGVAEVYAGSLAVIPTYGKLNITHEEGGTENNTTLHDTTKLVLSSNTEVTVAAPNITISGTSIKGVPIFAPYRTTAPTTAELPNNHYMIYRISATGIRLTMNCAGNIQTRSIL